MAVTASDLERGVLVESRGETEEGRAALKEAGSGEGAEEAMRIIGVVQARSGQAELVHRMKGDLRDGETLLKRTLCTTAILME